MDKALNIGLIDLIGYNTVSILFIRRDHQYEKRSVSQAFCMRSIPPLKVKMTVFWYEGPCSLVETD
jgi:hypothetical protein